MRLLTVLLVFTSFGWAQDSYDRLVSTAKLWAFVKYLHPRATAPDLDWDAAFTAAAPKVLAAKSDEQFSAAITEMLAPLHDPATRVIEAPQPGGSPRVMPNLKWRGDLVIVEFENGDPMQAMQIRNSLPKQLERAEAVVFDIRGMRGAANFLPSSIPVTKASVGPAWLTRRHSGYANLANSGSGGYESTWEIKDGLQLPVAPKSYRPVFLINSKTNVPQIALAVQNSGNGAIVAEDAMGPEPVDVGVPLSGSKVRVRVRIREELYPDGATGFAPNAILNQTGDAALDAAVEMAKSGKWPAPPARARLDRPGALFREKAYADQAYPSQELRLLAAARIWGVFHYFHPYSNLYGEDWDAVLKEFLPKMEHAANAREYHLAVAEMVSHVHDTHCFINSGELSNYYGRVPPPVEVRWIEDRPVVTRVVDEKRAAEIHPGDAILALDGEPVKRRIGELTPYISASTTQSLMSRVTQILLNGAEGSTVRVTLQTGNSAPREVTLTRGGENFQKLYGPDPSEPFRLLSPKIGYVDLKRLTNAQVDAMFEKFRDADAFIMDMRGYPQGTAWSIAPRLAEKTSPVAAQFRRNVVSGMLEVGDPIGTFYFEQRLPSTDKPRFKGKTVMLIDERAISQSEHSGLFYKTANGTVFIGSPTTGANGDVTFFEAPAGIRISFSGHDVRWADGKQLQRVGLVPDVPVAPTIEGVRAGKDEVLERAVTYLEKGR